MGQQGQEHKSTVRFPKGAWSFLRWQSLDALNKWRHSPEYEEIRKVGENFANYNIVAVEGPAQ